MTGPGSRLTLQPHNSAYAAAPLRYGSTVGPLIQPGSESTRARTARIPSSKVIDWSRIGSGVATIVRVLWSALGTG